MDIDRTQELEEKIHRLTRSIEEMRAEIAGLQGGAPSRPEASSSRRNFLRMGMAAAAGAVGWAAVKAVPAAAATGGYMVLGSANVAENSTTLQADAAITGGEVLGVESQNFSSSGLTTALATFSESFTAPLRSLGDSTGSIEGFDAWADGASAYAILGFTDQGTGVVGEALHGIGLYARTTGRIRQDPQGAAGKPGYSPNNMEQVRDADGVLWIHDASGNWRRVNSLRTDTADASGAFFKPFRLIDTRSGAIKAPGSVTSIPVAGQGSGASSVPANAIAVCGNLTAAGYTGGGFLTIMPDGITIGTGPGQYNPSSDPSSVNFIVGQYAIANSFICGLNPSNGSLEVYVGGPPLPGHSSHFIVDITGYIQ